MGNNTIAWNIIAFWFFFNISIGLVMQFLPDTSVLNPTPAGITYNADSMNNFNTEMEKQVNPSSIIQDASMQIWRIIDMVTLGILTRVVDLGKTYFLAGTDVIIKMYELVAGNEGSALKEFLRGTLNSLTIFLYTIAFINLITGKNVVENQ